MSTAAVPDKVRRHAEHVMGTVFSFAVHGGGRRLDDVLARIVLRLHRIDEVFSPYREDSDISRFGRGEIGLGGCDPEVAQVLARCREVAAQTDGFFTMRPGGVLDPSGWVKGWAVEEASRELREAGFERHCVSGGGDVQTAGGPWRVGIAHPLRPGEVVAVVAGSDVAVATSGVAERGAHVVDPYRGRPAEGLASLTLVGEGLASVDAWTTAAFAMGPDRGLAWVSARPGVEALAVLPDGGTRWTPGFPTYVEAARALG
ncbi:FAD:protein FMN transferase [Kitasatospora sp. NPDC001660]